MAIEFLLRISVLCCSWNEVNRDQPLLVGAEEQDTRQVEFITTAW
jgi:hypothetical protein